jgi:hypothetical protein
MLPERKREVLEIPRLPFPEHDPLNNNEGYITLSVEFGDADAAPDFEVNWLIPLSQRLWHP